MKKIALILVMFGWLHAQFDVTITIGTLNVRSGYGSKAKIVSHVKKGSKHTVFKEKNGRYKIGKNRWISKKYCKKIKPHVVKKSDSKKVTPHSKIVKKLHKNSKPVPHSGFHTQVGAGMYYESYYGHSVAGLDTPEDTDFATLVTSNLQTLYGLLDIDIWFYNTRVQLCFAQTNHDNNSTLPTPSSSKFGVTFDNHDILENDAILRIKWQFMQDLVQYAYSYKDTLIQAPQAHHQSQVGIYSIHKDHLMLGLEYYTSTMATPVSYVQGNVTSSQNIDNDFSIQSLQISFGYDNYFNTLSLKKQHTQTFAYKAKAGIGFDYRTLSATTLEDTQSSLNATILPTSLGLSYSTSLALGYRYQYRIKSSSRVAFSVQLGYTLDIVGSLPDAYTNNSLVKTYQTHINRFELWQGLNLRLNTVF